MFVNVIVQLRLVTPVALLNCHRFEMHAIAPVPAAYGLQPRPLSTLRLPCPAIQGFNFETLAKLMAMLVDDNKGVLSADNLYWLQSGAATATDAWQWVLSDHRRRCTAKPQTADCSHSQTVVHRVSSG